MTHTDCQNQAREFLNSCPAEMSITYVGRVKVDWDNRTHDMYTCIIKTQRGQMTVNFHDSIANTEIHHTTLSEYIEKHYGYRAPDIPCNIRAKANKELKAKKEVAKPTEYNILSCLEKYDVGSMDDFLHEYGYEIKCVADMTNFINTYNAVVKEYNDVRRCFTDKQIEALREIN